MIPGPDLWNGWTPGDVELLALLLGIAVYCLWDMARMNGRDK